MVRKETKPISKKSEERKRKGEKMFKKQRQFFITATNTQTDTCADIERDARTNSETRKAVWIADLRRL